MTLSSWFRDYIYVPLGGSRVTKSRYLFNVMATFFLSGLWHGANWTFVVWGLLHGSMLTVEFFTRAIREKIAPHFPQFLVAYIGRLYVFLFWSFSLIFFRAPSLERAVYIVSHLGGGFFAFLGHFFEREYLRTNLLAGEYRNEYTLIVCAITLLIVVQGISRRISINEWFERLPGIARLVLYSGGLWAILAWGVFAGRQFIYFAF